jgi:hypothetical protein
MLVTVVVVSATVRGRERRTRLGVPNGLRRRTASRRLRRLHHRITFTLAIACFSWLILAIPVTFFVRILPTSKGGPVAAAWFGVLLTIGLLLFPALIWESNRKRKLFRRVLHDAFLVCPNCCYSLKGLGDEGRCPECGREFIRRGLPKDWHDMEYMESGRLKYTVTPHPEDMEQHRKR